jgi:thiol:disulfide interchange protein DsbD
MRLHSIALAICITSPETLAAETPGGRASIEWLASSPTAEPGKPLQSAIRMVIDDGWHTYWLNPGDAGMKTTFEWTLPPGWTAGDPGFPTPSRFTTDGIASLGYKGTVLFPVTLTPPAGFTGTAELKASVSWLACSSEGCVPGDAEITLQVTSGPPVNGPHANPIEQARLRIPAAQTDEHSCLALDLAEAGDNLVLTLRRSGELALDPADCDAFPLTPQVVDPGAEIRFVSHHGSWRAEVPKSEYFSAPIEKFTLILTPKKLPANPSGAASSPLELRWSAKSPTKPGAKKIGS